jgi:ketosteroid isomerase-like protein
MAITLDRVREIFMKLEDGDGSDFFTHVADDVDWIVEGTHPLAGHYYSKTDFLAHTFTKLDKVLPHGTQLHVESALLSGDWAVVELHSLATAINGLRFDNRYCWLCRFRDAMIIEVRAYLDSALMARLFTENPIPAAVRAPYDSLGRRCGQPDRRRARRGAPIVSRC